jgi:hypothetical protein
MKNKCLCGEKFDEYKWQCIVLRNENAKSKEGYDRCGQPKNYYIYICPNCDTPKIKY